MKPLLTVRINSPEKLIWEGKAEAISSENFQGKFDILPQHANFITMIENKPIKITTPTEVFDYNFPNAVIYIHNNLVMVYTNI